MKCPNCGAEINGKFCAYCGTQVPEQNHYAICPRCGSKNINFKRENIRSTQKNKKGYVSSSNYKTTGCCEECGYTWNPQNEPKPSISFKTILWVLGWICFFPIPLTILIWRNEKITQPVKYGIVGVLWAIILIFGFAGQKKNTIEPEINNVPIITSEPTTQPTVAPTATPEPEAEEKLTVYDELSNHIDNFVENMPYDFTYIKMGTSENDPSVEIATVMKVYYVNGDTIAISATYDNNKNVIYCLTAPSVPTNDLAKYLKLLAPMLDPSLKGVEPNSFGFSNETIDTNAMTVSYNFGKNLMLSIRVLDNTYIDISVMGYLAE